MAKDRLFTPAELRAGNDTALEKLRKALDALDDQVRRTIIAAQRQEAMKASTKNQLVRCAIQADTAENDGLLAHYLASTFFADLQRENEAHWTITARHTRRHNDQREGWVNGYLDITLTPVA